MLTHTPGRHYTSFDDDIEAIHNYYERLVLQEIIRTHQRAQEDREFLADVACVALNRLPPRYIRHSVDMTFFMSPQETQEIEDKVTQAVSSAIVYVTSREHSDDPRVEVVPPKDQTPKKEATELADANNKKAESKKAKSKQVDGKQTAAKKGAASKNKQK